MGWRQAVKLGSTRVHRPARPRRCIPPGDAGMSPGKCCNSETPVALYQAQWNGTAYLCNCLDNGQQPVSPNPSLCCSQRLNTTSGTCQCAPTGASDIMQNSVHNALIDVGDACCSGVTNNTECAPLQPDGFNAKYFSNDACQSGHRDDSGACRWVVADACWDHRVDRGDCLCPGRVCAGCVLCPAGACGGWCVGCGSPAAGHTCACCSQFRALCS